MNASKITITISGPQGAGMTTIARVVENFLYRKGFEITTYDEGEKRQQIYNADTAIADALTKSMAMRGVSIDIHTRQDTKPE